VNYPNALIFICSAEPSRCNISWTVRSNIAASGVTYYPQLTTTDECKLGCSNQVADCVAAQIRYLQNSIQCFLLSDANKLSSAVVAQGIDLYVLTMNCGPVTGYYSTHLTYESLFKAFCEVN
jgi:hypothetical protein